MLQPFTDVTKNFHPRGKLNRGSYFNDDYRDPSPLKIEPDRGILIIVLGYSGVDQAAYISLKVC